MPNERDAGRRFAIAGLVAVLALPLSSGCDLVGGGNPTPGAKAVRFGDVWVRHTKDKHDREAYVVIGFTLKDSASKAIAAAGDLAVELKWKVGIVEWTAEGEAEVKTSNFRKAEGKPVRDGTWYVEPWNVYVIGAQYPGPAKHGYDLSLSFTTAEDKTLKWRRRVPVTR